MIPRTNRGIFCINELPDLAERLQVGLFNLMEERDVQIRGYRIRLPLDIVKDGFSPYSDLRASIGLRREAFQAG